MPAPFSWLAVAVVWAAAATWDAIMRISGNVGTLGTWWILAYWLTIAGCLNLGGWGLQRIGKARKGNDFIEFANHRAGWTGRKTARLYEFFVKSEARLGFAVLGYPAAVGLIAIAWLGPWTLALAAGWVALRGWELRRSRARRLNR